MLSMFISATYAKKKIAAIDNSKSYIKTVWGIGFKMDI